jgi:hypothetical protein
MVRRGLRASLVALALTAGATTARAQVIHFAGTTAGCFFTSSVCVPTSTAAVGGLKFSGAANPSFDGYTDQNGYLAIGGSADNFGLFSLTNVAYDYTGVNFLLEVMFSAPPGISTLNSAWLQGKVKTTSGGVTLHFDTTPTHLVATDGTEFDLRINELSLSRGTVTNPRVNYVNGSVQVTATPEPATFGLLAFGILGLIPFYRRGRRNSPQA